MLKGGWGRERLPEFLFAVPIYSKGQFGQHPCCME